MKSNARRWARTSDWWAIIGYALAIEVSAIGAALAIASVMGWL